MAVFFLQPWQQIKEIQNVLENCFKDWVFKIYRILFCIFTQFPLLLLGFLIMMMGFLADIDMTLLFFCVDYYLKRRKVWDKKLILCRPSTCKTSEFSILPYRTWKSLKIYEFSNKNYREKFLDPHYSSNNFLIKMQSHV